MHFSAPTQCECTTIQLALFNCFSRVAWKWQRALGGACKTAADAIRDAAACDAPFCVLSGINVRVGHFAGANEVCVLALCICRCDIKAAAVKCTGSSLLKRMDRWQ